MSGCPGKCAPGPTGAVLVLALAVAFAAVSAALAQAPAASDAPAPPPRVLLGTPSDTPIDPDSEPGLPDRAGSSLTLAEVLLSVHAYYPLVYAAEQERIVADGKLLSARGSFDLNLQASEGTNQGTYNNHRTDVGLQQPLAFMGASVFAGYRLGDGLFPTYYLDRLTADGGEFRAGLLLPLLRNRAIDSRRAGVQKSSIDRDVAAPSIQLQRIDISRNASRTYWLWVAAGHRVRIARQVLDIAERRDSQLALLIKQGRLAPIERVDNQRTIVDRQAKLVAATRFQQQSAIALSLYLRDPLGNPVVPDLNRLPAFPDLPELPTEEALQRDLQVALGRRPELQRWQLLRERTEVELRQAENQYLPALNLSLRGAQDAGGGSSSLSGPNGLNRAAYEAAVLMEMPVQRREARGRALAARGTLAQIRAQEQMARDRIGAELRDAVSIMSQAVDLEGRARDAVRLTRQMEQAEGSRYKRGQSNMLLVTIREIMTAAAQVQQVDALAEFFRGLADYFAAIGVDPSMPADQRHP